MTDNKDGIFFEFEGYRGYPARQGFEKTYHGVVMDIKDTVTFQGDTLYDAYDGFVDSIHDYIQFCKDRGETPDKPDKPAMQYLRRQRVFDMLETFDLNPFLGTTVEDVIKDIAFKLGWDASEVKYLLGTVGAAEVEKRIAEDKNTPDYANDHLQQMFSKLESCRDELHDMAAEVSDREADIKTFLSSHHNLQHLLNVDWPALHMHLSAHQFDKDGKEVRSNL